MKNDIKYNEVNRQVNDTAWLLYVCSIPYLIALAYKLTSFSLLSGLLIGTSFLGVLLSAQWMTLGLKNKEANEDDKIKSSSKYPMMFLASLSLGSTVFTSMFLTMHENIFTALGYGIGAIFGCWFWYGLDPIRSTVATSGIGEDNTEVMNSRYKMITNIQKLLKSVEDKEITESLENIVTLSNKVLNVLRKNPKKIPKARRFLNTYLPNIENIVKKYVNSVGVRTNKDLIANFKEVLKNAETAFTGQYDKFVANNVFDLDVDIEVLNTLLKNQEIK